MSDFAHVPAIFSRTERKPSSDWFRWFYFTLLWKHNLTLNSNSLLYRFFLFFLPLLKSGESKMDPSPPPNFHCHISSCPKRFCHFYDFRYVQFERTRYFQPLVDWRQSLHIFLTWIVCSLVLPTLNSRWRQASRRLCNLRTQTINPALFIMFFKSLVHSNMQSKCYKMLQLDLQELVGLPMSVALMDLQI